MTDLLLCTFGGWFGLHKFYRKEYGKGVLYLFTFGLLGIGWLTDTIKLIGKVRAGVDLDEEHRPRLEKIAELKQQKQEQLAARQEQEQKKIDELEQQGAAYCPRCKSTSLQYVERRKQLSIGRAIVGSAINPLAGAVGAVTSKKYKGYIKCLKCGHMWKS